MTPFITLTDIQDLKYIASSVKNNDSWLQFCSEAQLLDVKPWLTDALLVELENETITPPYSAANQILMDGGSYVYQTKTYLFQGLKHCIAYYAFARFTNRTSFNYTAAGIVLKDSDLSTPATTKDIQRLETEARLTADAIKCEIMTYLNRNYDLYPLWADVCRCDGCSASRPFTVFGD